MHENNEKGQHAHSAIVLAIILVRQNGYRTHLFAKSQSESQSQTSVGMVPFSTIQPIVAMSQSQTSVGTNLKGPITLIDCSCKSNVTNNWVLLVSM